MEIDRIDAAVVAEELAEIYSTPTLWQNLLSYRAHMHLSLSDDL